MGKRLFRKPCKGVEKMTDIVEILILVTAITVIAFAGLSIYTGLKFFSFNVFSALFTLGSAEYSNSEIIDLTSDQSTSPVHTSTSRTTTSQPHGPIGTKIVSSRVVPDVQPPGGAPGPPSPAQIVRKVSGGIKTVLQSSVCDCAAETDPNNETVNTTSMLRSFVLFLIMVKLQTPV